MRDEDAGRILCHCVCVCVCVRACVHVCVCACVRVHASCVYEDCVSLYGYERVKSTVTLWGTHMYHL